MAAKFKPKRTSANLLPNCVILNNIIGIFVVDHAPRKMKILARETPFLRKTIAAGKEAYNGPEENEPITLNGTYVINWRNYSDIGCKKGIFKYATLTVTK